MAPKPDIVAAALKHASSALAEAAKLLSANGDLEARLAQMPMPRRGSIKSTIPDRLDGQVSYLIDNANEMGSPLEDIELPPDLTTSDVPTEQAIANLEGVADQFDKEAFKLFVQTVAGYFSPPEEDETFEEMVEEAVVEFWEDRGSARLYEVAIGATNLEDEWPTDLRSDLWTEYISPPEWRWSRRVYQRSGFIKVLHDAINNSRSLRQSAHALEAAIANEAEQAIRSLEVAPKLEPRGPEHDTVIYKYKGDNSTIAGASARGMYVAELAKDHLRDETRELGHCIGNPRHGHPQLLESGTTKVFSIRTEAGKSKFTIEQFIADGKHPQQGNVTAGTVTEVKGKANRLPGFEPGSDTLTKPDEVKLVNEFLIKHLHKTPAEIEATNDIRGGVIAMKAMGLDPYSPPPAKPPRPKRDPRLLQAAARIVRADFARVP